MVRPGALLLTPVLPAGAGNGLAMRAGLLLEGLAGAGPVHVVAIPVFGGPASGSTALLDRHAARVTVLPLDGGPASPADLVAQLAAGGAGRQRVLATHPLPALCGAASPTAAGEVARLAEEATVVWVFREYLLPFLDALLDRRRRPALVVDVDDVESATRRRLGQLEEADRFERLEAHYLPLMDSVVTCSAADAQYLRARYGLEALTSVPNAVRPPSGPCAPAPATDLLFVGTLSYGPNVAGARWLCQEVLAAPDLAGVTVTLAGSRPGPEILGLARDGRVTIAGDVADVAPWYAGARVAVVPLPPGGGTRIKVIEAMAHGLPVVSTAAGAEGLAVGGEQPPVVVADSPAAFAAACRRLLDDPAAAAQLARAGRNWVRERASIDVVAPTVAAVARSVAPRPGP